ncbi:hypothetical protein XENOCAPTIV_020548, partial [Xenoophorus captivus]
AAMYEIHEHNRTCKKSPLKVEFQPLGIPKNASLLGQVVVGSSSGPGQGLLVNTWVGELPDKSGKYMATVTEFACIPVSSAYHTKEFGWMVTSFFNNIIGIEDPNRLNPPSFCTDAETSSRWPFRRMLPLWVRLCWAALQYQETESWSTPGLGRCRRRRE